MIWSDEVYRLLGVASSEFDGSQATFLEHVHPEDRERLLRQAKDLHKGKNLEHTHRLLRADGQERIVHVQGVVTHVLDGVLRRARGFVQDITESKQAEAALAESEQRLAEAQSIGHIGSWEFDGQSGGLTWSDEVYRIFARDKAVFEPNHDSFMACVHPEDRAGVLQSIEWEFASDENNKFDYRIVRPGGAVRNVRETSRTFAAADGKLIRRAGTLQDITEQENAAQRLNMLENEVQRRYRINAMGELASSLAHELNQPLAAIGNYIEASKHIVNSGDQEFSSCVTECLDNAAVQARRAAGVIKCLRRYIGKDHSAYALEQLNETIREISELASIGAVASGVRVELDLAENLPPVMIDRVQIQQVIANLMHNAAESMATCRQRILTISSHRSPAQELVVAIHDTGAGLSSQALDKLFKPFHSSKVGGMGIGLAISKKIVETHGGRIWVTPNEGDGTIFQFSLPLEEETSD